MSRQSAARSRALLSSHLLQNVLGRSKEIALEIISDLFDGSLGAAVTHIAWLE